MTHYFQLICDVSRFLQNLQTYLIEGDALTDEKMNRQKWGFINSNYVNKIMGYQTVISILKYFPR